VLHTRREAARERNRLVASEHTAQRDAELQRARLVALFTQAPNPIAILRGADHVIELANPSACLAWGRTHDAVINRPLFEAVPELRGQVFEELLAQVLRTGVSYHGKEQAPVRPA
jgi:PAS domain-containing protein